MREDTLEENFGTEEGGREGGDHRWTLTREGERESFGFHREEQNDTKKKGAATVEAVFKEGH
jgi:hypothetical protein